MNTLITHFCSLKLTLEKSSAHTTLSSFMCFTVCRCDYDQQEQEQPAADDTILTRVSINFTPRTKTSVHNMVSRFSLLFILKVCWLFVKIKMLRPQHWFHHCPLRIQNTITPHLCGCSLYSSLKSKRENRQNMSKSPDVYNSMH